MISQPFDYAAPDTLDAAFSLLAGRDDGKVLGGGTVLVPLMGLGDFRPRLVVDLRNLPLGAVRSDPEGISIGAAASYTTIEADSLVRDRLPLLAHVCREITGGPQITNQATAGGSICFANPAADIPACIVALNANLRLGSAAGIRVIPAIEFFTGAFETVRRPDEILLEIVIPGARWTRFGYVKQKHTTSSWPIVTAACLADDKGNIRIAVGGAGHRPYVIETVATAEETPTETAVRIGQSAREELTKPWSDELAPAPYRERIVGAVVARAVKQALGVHTA